MAGTLSKGITLSYKLEDAGEFIKLTNLQEVPELGGDAEPVETTTLDDAAHMYIDGILNYGDSIAFKFLYVKEQFMTLNGIDNATWKVELPDTTACSFGGTASVKLDGVGVNAPITYTLSIKPNTELEWA